MWVAAISVPQFFIFTLVLSAYRKPEESAAVEDFNDEASFVHITALVHGSTLLPCNPFTSEEDTLLLVMWYKGEIGPPIYSVDFRDSKEVPKHWSSPDGFYGRTNFSMAPPIGLMIDRITENDAGLYRCRVDLMSVATKFVLIKLNVITPPGVPIIVDNYGRKMSQVSYVFNEGDDVQLTCTSLGGKPTPKLYWTRLGIPISSSFEDSESDQVKSGLILTNLPRSEYRVKYSCFASNNNISDPSNSNMEIDMNLKPTKVNLIGADDPMSVGRFYEVHCTTFGSRPPATISWFIGSAKIEHNGNNFTVEKDENVTTSYLFFQPSAEDNGKSIRCLSENPSIPNSSITDEKHLEVYYPPKVRLSVASQSFQEGNDIKLSCNISANPSVYKVVWKKNGLLFNENVTTLGFLETVTFHLYNITRFDSGTYTCLGSNVEGDATSNAIDITIQYSPICDQEPKVINGVNVREDIELSCQVSSLPEPSVFYWSFNNSRSYKTLYPSKTEGQMSFIKYQLKTLDDYGTFSCLSQNKVGKQRDPCIFNIIPAGLPEKLTNCSLGNITTNALNVSCIPGFNGGLEQHFSLEVYDVKAEKVLRSKKSKSPSFYIKDLPHRDIILILYANNSKGKSDDVRLEFHRLKLAELKPQQSTEEESNTFLGITLGLVVTFLLLVWGMVIILLRYRRRKDSKANVNSEGENYKTADENNVLKPSALSGVTGEVDSETLKTPDIIPGKNAKKNVEVVLDSTGIHHVLCSASEVTLNPLPTSSNNQLPRESNGEQVEPSSSHQD